jgi:hypothetical protein
VGRERAGRGQEEACEEGARKVPAQPPKKRVQGMRRGGNLRAQPHTKQLQAMRRGKHLRAQPRKKQVQAMQRFGHL